VRILDPIPGFGRLRGEEFATAAISLRAARGGAVVDVGSGLRGRKGGLRPHLMDWRVRTAREESGMVVETTHRGERKVRASAVFSEG
jgi:hypothetical protein